MCEGEATERSGQAHEQRFLHQLHHGKHLSESIRPLHNPSHQTALTESVHHNSLCHAATKAGKTMCSTLRLRVGASPTLVAHLVYEMGVLRERITLARAVSSPRHPTRLPTLCASHHASTKRSNRWCISLSTRLMRRKPTRFSREFLQVLTSSCVLFYPSFLRRAQDQVRHTPTTALSKLVTCSFQNWIGQKEQMGRK